MQIFGPPNYSCVCVGGEKRKNLTVVVNYLDLPVTSHLYSSVVMSKGPVEGFGSYPTSEIFLAVSCPCLLFLQELRLLLCLTAAINKASSL